MGQSDLSQGLSLCILLLLALGAVRSVENVAGTVGKSVYLSVKLDLQAQRQVTWKFNSSIQIVTALPGGSPTYNGDYRDRCTLYGNTTLRLDSLTPTDTGEYSLSVANMDTGAPQSGSVYLTVYSAERSIDNVAGTEGKSVYLTVRLDLPAQRQVTWRVNSSSQIVTAVTGGSPVYAADYRDRCTLYGNATLQLDNLTPTDTGEYSLTVTNLGTGATQSGSVYLTVYILDSSSSSQLSPGAIAGIVIAALFVVALIPLTVIFILRKKNNNNTPTPTDPVYENTGAQAPNHYDRIIPGSKEDMAGNNPQESSYQELQFSNKDVYDNLRKTPR